MNGEEWATLGVFVWLSAYLFFFLGALRLDLRERSTARLLIVIGFGLLVIVNLMLLADYLDITFIDYEEIFNFGSFNKSNDNTAAWQRWYGLAGLAMDVVGKCLAGIGLIMEGRRQITKMRMAEYYNNLPTS